jgi:hypothetical protein
MNHSFNWISYWNRVIPVNETLVRIDELYKGREDLDCFSLQVDGEFSAPFIDESYVKFTMEGFRFEQDVSNNYGGVIK